MNRLGIAVLASLLQICVVASVSGPATAQKAQTPVGQFQVSSTTFTNGTTLPLSMIGNNVVNGLNTCSIDGSQGGSESPELSWSNAPAKTQSFVVVAYDTTAAFTHWGMYNIPATTTELEENAGVVGSQFGAQITNDFFVNANYAGPCPPVGLAPFTHRYIFTVYALDTTLTLPGFRFFSPVGETLYHALIVAAEGGHILATAKIVGLYSATPTK